MNARTARETLLSQCIEPEIIGNLRDGDVKRVCDSIRDLLFVLGGLIHIDTDNSEEWVATNATLVYDWKQDVWSRIADMNSARYAHSCTLATDNSLYAIAGKFRNTNTNANDIVANAISEQYYLTSIERLCVSDDCLQQSERSADESKEWQTLSEELSPARGWTAAVTVQCPFENGCKDSSEVMLITGGYKHDSFGNGAVVNYVSLFDANTDSVDISDASCMRLGKSAHLAINDKENGMVFTFGGLSTDSYYLSQVERLNLTYVFSKKKSKSGASNSQTLVGAIGGILLILVIVSALVYLFYQRQRERLQQLEDETRDSLLPVSTKKKRTAKHASARKLPTPTATQSSAIGSYHSPLALDTSPDSVKPNFKHTVIQKR